MNTKILVDVRTVVECADLYGGCTGALATCRLGRQSDVVHSIRGEVCKQVRVEGRGNGHVDVLPEVRVVIVELVAVNQLVR